MSVWKLTYKLLFEELPFAKSKERLIIYREKKMEIKATYRFLERYYCSVALRIWRKVMVDDIRDPTSTRIQNKKVVNDVGDELMDVVRKFLVYIWYSKVYFKKKLFPIFDKNSLFTSYYV